MPYLFSYLFLKLLMNKEKPMSHNVCYVTSDVRVSNLICKRINAMFVFSFAWPKCLFVFLCCIQDGCFLGNKVFQLYAVNQRDKATVFHRLIEAGDDVRLLEILLGSLETEHEQVVNSSDVRGFTPLHLACKLGRRKIIQKLTDFAVNFHLFSVWSSLI